jgi:hypothetical protein
MILVGFGITRVLINKPAYDLCYIPDVQLYRMGLEAA